MIKPIHSEEDYQKTLAQVESLWGAKPPSDPVEAIFFLMDQMHLNRKDLELYLGPKSRVSDVLNRKRSLTMHQIVKLHKGLHIPYECLIEEERQYL